MADSEDDERRGRFDKFARERDYVDRRRDDDRRSSGYGRNDFSNGNKRSAPRRDDYPADAKRSRQISEAEELGPSDPNAIPALLPFKKWLTKQDDDITVEEATPKYAEYKAEHERLLLEKFFTTHKEEEWFRSKYHPEESKRRKDEHVQNVKKRNEIFKELHEKGFFIDASLDQLNAKKLIFILDAVAVKLEGGTDEDVEILKHLKVEDESLADIEDKNSKDEVVGTETDVEENGDKGKKLLLHKTSSLHLRSVDATITHQEVEEVCKRFPGFLRLCLLKPDPSKKFARPGLATFKKDVNIKQIAMNINSIRIRDTDLHATFHPELRRKIRTVNGLSGHKSVAKADLAVAAKLAAIYDLRAGLYSDASEEEREVDIRLEADLVASSPNPFIRLVRRHIQQELSAEEAELLGTSASSTEDEGDKFPLQRDDDILKALDTILLYLRIVHSVDFYMQAEYANEDNMPNRRGEEEEGKSLLTARALTDYKNSVNKGVKKLADRQYISEDDVVKLGKKNPEETVEAFIKVNTVEISAEKWLCPLSGKKFKGPDFIRKHLQSKHAEKLDEAKQDALFFNNFLADPERPKECEPAASTREERNSSSDDRNRHDDRGRGYGGDRGRYSGGSQRHSFGGGGGMRDDRSRPPPRMGGSGRYFDGPPPAGTIRDSRAPISYRDLDEPSETPF